MSIVTEIVSPTPLSRTNQKTERPHRRLSLTRPTLPDSATSMTESLPPQINLIPSISSTHNDFMDTMFQHEGQSQSVADTGAIDSIAIEPTANSSAPVVRVMAYLSSEEAELLDDLWMQGRKLAQKPSKSDILRAALSLAAVSQEDLTAMLSKQRNNTLSRQRISKKVKA